MLATIRAISAGPSQDGKGHWLNAACHKTFKSLYLVSSDCRDTPLRYSSQVKPISYLKANAAEVLTDLVVWMRDLLGASDDPEGWRQSV